MWDLGRQCAPWVAALRHFMACSEGPEKTLGELKQHPAFDAIPSRERQTNGLWQQLPIPIHNWVWRPSS